MKYFIIGALLLLTLPGCKQAKGKKEPIALTLKREGRFFVIDLGFYNRINNDPLQLFNYTLRIGFDTVQVYNDMVELASQIEIIKGSRCRGNIAAYANLYPRVITGKSDTTYHLEGLITIDLLSNKSMIIGHSENKRINYDSPATEASINSRVLHFGDILKKNGNNILLMFDLHVEYDAHHKVSNMKLISKADEFLQPEKGIYYLRDIQGITEDETPVYLKKL
jgi:hypothetical protein